jgi:hypothetical protein
MRTKGEPVESVSMVVAMLHNSLTGRWHPACFKAWPHPLQAGAVQYRSMGHHTEGFVDRTEALEAAKHVAATLLGTGCASACDLDDHDLEWNGEWPILLP